MKKLFMLIIFKHPVTQWMFNLELKLNETAEYACEVLAIVIETPCTV